MTGSKNRDQDVRSAKCRQWRAIKDREKEKPQCSQMAERGGEAMGTIRLRILEKNVQRGQYINFARLEAPLGSSRTAPFAHGWVNLR